MAIPLWYKREISLGAMGPDVRVVRRKLGFSEDGPYDRAVQAKVMGVARKRKIDTDGEVNEDVAEELGPAADESQPPTWWARPADYEYQLWDEGEDVRALNKALGFTDNDNRFHPEQEAAVRQLQSAKGFTLTGRVNQDLARHIGEA
jgi:hypothetical protein